MFTTTTLTDSIVPMSGLTPYASLGDKGVFMLLALWVACLYGCDKLRVALMSRASPVENEA